MQNSQFKRGGNAPPEIKVGGPRPIRPSRFRHLCSDLVMLFCQACTVHL